MDVSWFITKGSTRLYLGSDAGARVDLVLHRMAASVPEFSLLFTVGMRLCAAPGTRHPATSDESLMSTRRRDLLLMSQVR
jgi:hypothetical protein